MDNTSMACSATQARSCGQRERTSPTSGRTGGNEDGTQPPIPTLSPSSRVVAQHGRHDHLEVSAQLGCVCGEDEDISRFRQLLGAPPATQRDDRCSRLYGKLCCVAPYMGDGSRPLKIRSKAIPYAGDTLGKPLLSGKFYTRRTRLGDIVTCNLKAYLHLNPTRALNHRRRELTGRRTFPWEEKLLLPSPNAHIVEIGADGKSNILPAELSHAEFRTALNRYLRAVFTALTSEIERAAVPSRVTRDPSNAPESLSLKRCETYWEFNVPEVARFLEGVAPLLRAYHRKNLDREHGMHGIDEKTEGNGRSVRLYLGKGEEVTLYAKKADRLRIEVRHYPGDQSGLVQGGYSCSSIDELKEKLSCFRERAASKVNVLLGHLSEWQGQSPDQLASSARYASHWFQALGFEPASVELLEMLRNKGRIAAGRMLTQEQARMCRRAKERGLIVGRSGVYLPARSSQDSLTAPSTAASVLVHESETQAAPLVVENVRFSSSLASGRRIPPSPPKCKLFIARSLCPS